MSINMSDNFEAMVGKQVSKSARCETEPKPFKSGLKVNTVKGIINHPQLNIPAFTFLEDESYVECRRCEVVGDQA